MANRKRRNYNKEEKETHPEVELANQISILDFAKKEGIEITYEDAEIAILPDITGNGEITVHKNSNSWEHEQNGKITHGNTIRFVARMNEMEWPDAIDFLVEDRNKYMSSEQYNQVYENKHQTKVKSRQNRNSIRNKEVLNDISLVDYARSIGLDVKEVNERLAIISSYPGLLINKKMNTWDYRSMNVTNGDIINFISKFNKVKEEEAILLLEAYEKTMLNHIENKEEMKERKKEVDQISQESNLEDVKNLDQENSITQEKTESSEQDKSQNQDIEKQKTCSREQLAEIIAGLKTNIDITIYNNPELNPSQMRELRLGLKEGINMKEFNNPSVSAEYLKEIRLALQEGLDISLLQLDENKKCIYQVDQAREIRLGLKNKLSIEQIKVYAKSNLDAASMKELRLGLQDGFDKIKEFNNGCFTAEDIHTIRVNLIVKSIIESIQLHIRKLYDNILEVFRNSVINKNLSNQLNEIGQTVDGAIQDNQVKSDSIELEKEIINESKFLLKDVAEILYEAMEDEFSEKGLTYEEKRVALIDSIKELINTAKNMEHVTNVDISNAMDQAVETFVEETEMKNLQRESLKSLQQEYVDKFFEQENQYNAKLAEFTQSIIEEKNISYNQKSEIFYQTLGEMYGKSVAENWIANLYPKQDETLENVNKAIQKLNPEQLNKLYQNIEQQIEVVEESEYELEQ